MKKLIILTIVFLALGVSSQAQNVAATEQFTQLYSDATDLTWEEKEDIFLARFSLADGRVMKAVFAKNGDWLKSLTLIEEADLPAIVAPFINKEYAVTNYIEIEKIEKTAAVEYEVKFDAGGEAIKLIFDKEGNFLKKEKPSF